MLNKLIFPVSFALLIFASIINLKVCPFNVEVSENQVIDYNFFQRLLEFDTDSLKGHWDRKTEFGNFIYLRSNGDLELKKLMRYMKKNNYMIAPGKYLFLNDIWMFHEGYFIFFPKDKIRKMKVFKFQKIPEDVKASSE